jgi:hypothetical protein
MCKQFFLLILLLATLLLIGCAKIKLGDPVALPGFGEEFGVPTCPAPAPKFQNGDIVVYKMLMNETDMVGIVMQCDYKYIPRLNTYYCIVDFYPSSAVHIDFSKFDNYERRYVYEYELIKDTPELERKRTIPARWDWTCSN